MPAPEVSGAALTALKTELGHVLQYDELCRAADAAMPGCLTEVRTDSQTVPHLLDRIFFQADRLEQVPKLIRELHDQFAKYPRVRRAIETFERASSPVAQSQRRQDWVRTLRGYYEYLRDTDSPRRDRLEALRRSAMRLYRELEPSPGNGTWPDWPDETTAKAEGLLGKLDELLDGLYVYTGLVDAARQATSVASPAELRVVASNLQQLAAARRTVVDRIRALYAAF